MRLLLPFSIAAILGCAGLAGAEGANPGECLDGIDNDGDGIADCVDTDCVDAAECGGGVVDTDADSDTDSDSDTDADADPAFQVLWDSKFVSLSIDGGSGTYSFGMAQQQEMGWYGEDCIEGREENSGPYDICHDEVSKSGITLETVDSPQDLVANVTTLMNDTIDSAGHVAYVFIANETDDCWVSNDAEGDYDDFGCTEVD